MIKENWKSNMMIGLKLYPDLRQLMRLGCMDLRNELDMKKILGLKSLLYCKII